MNLHKIFIKIKYETPKMVRCWLSRVFHTDYGSLLLVKRLGNCFSNYIFQNLDRKTKRVALSHEQQSTDITNKSVFVHVYAIHYGY